MVSRCTWVATRATGVATSLTAAARAAAAGCAGAAAGLAKWLDSGGRVDAVDTARHRGSLLHAAARADQVDCIKVRALRGGSRSGGVGQLRRR